MLILMDYASDELETLILQQLPGYTVQHVVTGVNITVPKSIADLHRGECSSASRGNPALH